MIALRQTLALGIAVVALIAGASPAVAFVPNEPGPYRVNDPKTWSNQQLAEQTIFMCAALDNLPSMRGAVRRGIGGIALLGGATPPHLHSVISALVAQAPGGVAPIIASDEEGGDVQRLDQAIYPLPSAAKMGTWSTTKLTATAQDYGTRMRELGVTMSFAPVADLAIPGHFIAESGRSFSANPTVAARSVIAWAAGLRAAGIAPVLKHWPGHGRALDTHTSAAVIPKLSTLKKSDLIPFERAFTQGFHAVMVGHLAVPGFTRRNEPASLSSNALSYLRQQLGKDGLIMTDSLSMSAATTLTHGSVPQAAVRSLRAGADIALTCGGTAGLEAAVTRAIGNGTLSRVGMEEKVQRILAYKRSLGLVIRPGMTASP